MTDRIDWSQLSKPQQPKKRKSKKEWTLEEVNEATMKDIIAETEAYPINYELADIPVYSERDVFIEELDSPRNRNKTVWDILRTLRRSGIGIKSIGLEAVMEALVDGGMHPRSAKNSIRLHCASYMGKVRARQYTSCIYVKNGKWRVWLGDSCLMSDWM